MRIWKAATLLLLVVSAGACTNAPDATKETSVENKEATEAATPDKAAAPAPAPASTPAPAPKAAPAPRPAPAPAPAPPKVVTVPAGTTLTVVLSSSLSSAKNKAGDTFTGNLAEPVVVNGATVLPKGTSVEGKVVAAEGAGKVSGKASMSIALTSANVKGKTISLNTRDVSAQAESTKGRDAAVIGGGAGVGAAIGAIAGGKKGAAIGAAVGGGAGTGTVLATKGKEVEYPAESRVEFTLEQDARL